MISGLEAATVLAVPVGNAVSGAVGFRPVLWAVVALSAGAGLALAALPALKPATGGRTRTEITASASAAAPLLAVSLLVSIADFAVYTYVVPLLEYLLATDGTTIAVLLFLYGCAGVSGNLLGGQLADRWGPNRTVVTSLALLGASTLATPWTRNVVLVGVIVVVWGVSGWMVVPALQSEIIALRPSATGLLATANASMIYTGMALGSLLGGTVITTMSPSALGPVGTGAAVLALILYLARHRRTSEAMAPPLDPAAER
ncbi:MFS transporter [Streptomyces griseus]|uniref:MFS transporter n=1 Tax=Streptomyces griseus TaxID=1911 RepID=UPI0013BD647B|nr:MFS transporter [Streptomyces griseus]